MPEVFNSSDSKSEKPSTLEATEEILHGVRKKRVHRRNEHSPYPIDTPQITSRGRKRHVNEYSEVMKHEKVGKNPLNAFWSKPEKVAFMSQSQDEEIILVLRKHPITQIKWIVTAILLCFLPMLIVGLGVFNALPQRYELAIHIGWYLLILGFVVESALSWFFNVYIITDERIVDVDFLSLIYRNISTAKIDNIEDVTAKTGGVVRSVFNFGTVQVQTAAERNEFEFEDVPQPNKVTKLLNELILEEEQEKVEGRVQ